MRGALPLLAEHENFIKALFQHSRSFHTEEKSPPFSQTTFIGECSRHSGRLLRLTTRKGGGGVKKKKETLQALSKAQDGGAGRQPSLEPPPLAFLSASPPITSLLRTIRGRPKRTKAAAPSCQRRKGGEKTAAKMATGCPVCKIPAAPSPPPSRWQR